MPGHRDVASLNFVESVRSGSVTGAIASQQLASENPFRKALYIVNDGPTIVYVKFSPGCTPTDYNIRLADYANIALGAPVYTGSIHVRHVAATGSVYWTELS